MKIENEHECDALAHLVRGKMMRRYGRKADRACIDNGLLEDLEILLFNADPDIQPTYSYMSGGEKPKKTDVKKPSQPENTNVEKSTEKTDVKKQTSTQSKKAEVKSTTITETAAEKPCENSPKRLRRDEETDVESTTYDETDVENRINQKPQSQKTDVKKITSNPAEKTDVQIPKSNRSEKTDVKNTRSAPPACHKNGRKQYNNTRRKH